MFTVLFACIHNAGRSQIAKALFNQMADPSKARALSAGTDPAEAVHPIVVESMTELAPGFSKLASEIPQRLTESLWQGADLLVTLGCGESCPVTPGLAVQDWPLADPKGQDLAAVRAIRDELGRRVASLVLSRQVQRDPSEATIRSLVHSAKRVAVLGIKTEDQAAKPAFYVPAYLAQVGITIIPVPVYYPEVTTILGQKVYRTVSAIPTEKGPLDLVCVFRRPEEIAAHVEDLLAARPLAVWFQQGIRDEVSAMRLRMAGIEVVSDRCLLVEHRRLS